MVMVSAIYLAEGSAIRNLLGKVMGDGAKYRALADEDAGPKGLFKIKFG